MHILALSKAICCLAFAPPLHTINHRRGVHEITLSPKIDSKQKKGQCQVKNPFFRPFLVAFWETFQKILEYYELESRAQLWGLLIDPKAFERHSPPSCARKQQIPKPAATRAICKLDFLLREKMRHIC